MSSIGFLTSFLSFFSGICSSPLRLFFPVSSIIDASFITLFSIVCGIVVCGRVTLEPKPNSAVGDFDKGDFEAYDDYEADDYVEDMNNYIADRALQEHFNRFK